MNKPEKRMKGLKNETSGKVFVKMDECILMPNRPGDFTLYIKNGTLENLN